MRFHPIKQLPLAASLLSLLAACQSVTSQQAFAERLQSWKGTSFDKLVQAWGIPERHTFDETSGYAEWQNSQLQRGPSVSIGLGKFGSRVGGSIGTTIHGDAKQERCIIQIQFNSHKEASRLISKGPHELCEPLVPKKKVPKKNSSQEVQIQKKS